MSENEETIVRVTLAEARAMKGGTDPDRYDRMAGPAG
jgi:hypothetical protein